MKTSIPILLLLSIFFSSCTYDTEELITNTNKTYPNNKTISVEKKSAETTSTGIFTKLNYGTTHSFSYRFSIKKDNIDWDGGSAEPKNIIFKENSIYIRCLKKKRIKEEITDSITNTSTFDYHTEINEAFEQHIDNRYFFKLFGDDFWTSIEPEQYANIKESKEEYEIPNDNELNLQEEAILSNDSTDLKPEEL